MAYTIMNQLLNSKSKKSKEWFENKANRYYGADQLTDEQYAEIIVRINERFE